MRQEDGTDERSNSSIKESADRLARRMGAEFVPKSGFSANISPRGGDRKLG